MNTQKIENLYGKIGNTLNQTIPEDWSKVFMRAEIWSENNEGKEVSCTGGLSRISYKTGNKKFLTSL